MILVGQANTHHESSHHALHKDFKQSDFSSCVESEYLEHCINNGKRDLKAHNKEPFYKVQWSLTRFINNRIAVFSILEVEESYQLANCKQDQDTFRQKAPVFFIVSKPLQKNTEQRKHSVINVHYKVQRIHGIDQRGCLKEQIAHQYTPVPSSYLTCSVVIVLFLWVCFQSRLI